MDDPNSATPCPGDFSSPLRRGNNNGERHWESPFQVPIRDQQDYERHVSLTAVENSNLYIIHELTDLFAICVSFPNLSFDSS
jgi:hypothetical protein